MRILITGVSGFLGGHLARRLIDQGHSVAGTSLGEAPPLPANVEVFEVDLRAPGSVAEAVDAAAPDLIFHLAGLTHVGTSWQHMADYYQVNMEGTARLMAAADGRPVVFTSSAEVYGLVPESEQPISETRPAAPRSPYALTKAAAEHLVRAGGGRTVRLFNIVGPGQSTEFALPSFARQLRAIASGTAEPVLKVGNLGAQRDFTHVLDAVDGLLRVSEEGVAGGTFNLGSGVACSIREALDTLMDIANVDAEISIDPERLRPVDIPLLRADASRLKAMGWEPKYDLRRALQELWESPVD